MHRLELVGHASGMLIDGETRKSYMCHLFCTLCASDASKYFRKIVRGGGAKGGTGEVTADWEGTLIFVC